ncbi:hypothetical protein ABT213_30470 [Streptomyces sp. NPDC001674]|uniref:hypothetical protein n=1 Tax=Streptomyces sp. NPDC001674 TaxID=3154394 RepID=UPI0033263B7B
MEFREQLKELGFRVGQAFVERLLAGRSDGGGLVFALADVQAGEDRCRSRAGPSIHVMESSSGSGEAGAQAPHQRSVDASGPVDTTPRIMNNKGEVMPDPKAGSSIAEP